MTMFRNMLPFDERQSAKYGLSAQRIRLKILEKHLMESMVRADFVIFVSEHGRDVVAARAGARMPRATVIPHGVSDEFRSSKRAGSDVLGAGSDYVLYVSNIEPYKNQVEVVAAFALAIRCGVYPNLKLVLVGVPSSRVYARRVRKAIADQGVNDRVMVVGHVDHDDLPSAYRNARVVVFASETENCPNVLLEAMAAGSPLAVSNRRPMPEFVRDAALYFDPTSPLELAACLQRLLSEESLRSKLARRAQEYSLDYDWVITAERTWKVLSALAMQGGENGYRR